MPRSAGRAGALGLLMLLPLCSFALAAADLLASLSRPGDQLLMPLHAKGDQIYECRSASGAAPVWTFKAPRADLFANGELVGHHFAGPSWACRDGSRVVGKVVAKADGADPVRDVPWLRLDVQSHSGSGALDPVAAVLRINTRGGVLAGACTQPGTEMDVPYEGDYVFIR